MEKAVNNRDEIDNYWRDLDARVIMLIASYIPSSLLYPMGIVCTRWNNILTPQIWRTIYTVFSRKSNKTKILKKYGKFIKKIKENSIPEPNVGEDCWLDHCPQLYYQYLPRNGYFHSYAWELVSFNKLPQSLAPIPLMKLSSKIDWMSVIMLSKMKNPPVIEGYYVDSIFDDENRMLSALPEEMKLNAKTLELDIDTSLFFNTLVYYINQFPNIKQLELYTYRDKSIDEWINLDTFIKISREISTLILDLGATNVRALYRMKFSSEKIGYCTAKISSLILKHSRYKFEKDELLKVPNNNRFNFFKFLISSSPYLTYVEIPFVSYSILKLLSKNCPNLEKLITKSPLPVFDSNVSVFKKLVQLSISSLDEFHSNMGDGFQSIFPNVRGVYIDHWWAHTPNQCTHHELFLIPNLFPKLVSLKLSHDISETTLQRLMSQDQSLHITHLYLHSPRKSWPNLIQLIKQKCNTLQSITYDWKRYWSGIENAPIQDLIKEFPDVNIFISNFKKAFKYTDIYTYQEFIKLIRD
ncbi:hypothetical protein CONCODRAFT_78876 [Conidiobolus coronatus NRRL 28638]|uniref:Uncharacterized protein n=1 Tax=Conidiobolus coronatus (strain ATCC 28846 / CBS 209.66 / NRRL 28638) TaxID=796925 RepID=A0A137P5W9_CONC2|nr:hypothetical protein CONCODRAFT_78876 [Conidiobolus coronatus NRRL 28638]|eukprot:KXN70405.1 hypothetical protein CONCODRAFT_78876 [Conidiobolus coronatus NRRL 28638]